MARGRIELPTRGFSGRVSKLQVCKINDLMEIWVAQGVPRRTTMHSPPPQISRKDGRHSASDFQRLAAVTTRRFDELPLAFSLPERRAMNLRNSFPESVSRIPKNCPRLKPDFGVYRFLDRLWRDRDATIIPVKSDVRPERTALEIALSIARGALN